MEFSESLGVGKICESIVLSRIREKYPLAYMVDGYFKGYDIFVPELGFGVEVKMDKKSKYTGNIVIEVECDGKPSALTTTEAKYWVIYDGDSYNWFEVDDLRALVVGMRPYTFVGKGDTYPKKAYLIKKRLLYKYRIYGK